MMKKVLLFLAVILLVYAGCKAFLIKDGETVETARKEDRVVTDTLVRVSTVQNGVNQMKELSEKLQEAMADHDYAAVRVYSDMIQELMAEINGK